MTVHKSITQYPILPILENIGQYPIPQCQYRSNPSPNRNVSSDRQSPLYDKSASLRCDCKLFHWLYAGRVLYRIVDHTSMQTAGRRFWSAKGDMLIADLQMLSVSCWSVVHSFILVWCRRWMICRWQTQNSSALLLFASRRQLNTANQMQSKLHYNL